MHWVLILAFVVSSLTDQNVLLVNHTGLAVARFKIGERTFDTLHSNESDVLVHVTPGKHDLKIVFRGGAQVEWPHFNFKGVREVIFERHTNQISARTE